MATSPAPIPHFESLLVLVGALGGVLAGFYLFCRGFGLLARKRLIENIPRSEIRSAALGQVEISGKALGPYTIISPLSLSDCYYYKAVAYPTGEDAKQAHRSSAEILSVPFFLGDQTGNVMVDARCAETDLPCTYEGCAEGYTAGGCVQQFLARRGLAENARVQLVEYSILAGDPLFVLGRLSENPPETKNLESKAGADWLSPEAAALQRQSMLESIGAVPAGDLRLVGKKNGEEKQFNLHPAVVLRKGAKGEPFIISRHSQREVIRELAGKSLLYVWGGPLLALASVAYLLLKLTEF
ncbi:MAG: hypothetical protein JO249_07510 [Acidobacteria bacterium]|nr:hypothetical protein [Acidobacteriota bacterium]